MRKKLIIPLIFVGLALLIVVAPVSARTVENGGTIYIGEEHLYLKFLEGSETKLFGTYDWRHEGMVIGQRPQVEIDLSDSYTDASFPASKFYVYDINQIWWSLKPDHTWNTSNDLSVPHFILANPVVTTTPTTPPTPVPTPSTGNIVISSSPSDATVYVDNVIKGITPLTISVANGEHVVRIRLDGYQESKTSVTVNGADVSIKPVLIPVVTTVATTVPTTIMTTVPTTMQTTTQTTVITTEITTIPTTATINYSETIAVMQSKIAAQETKNIEQDVAIAEQSEQIGFLQQMIDSILGFLGLK